MSRSDIMLRIDATYGLKIKAGDKIRKGQRVSAHREHEITSPVSGVVKSVRFEPDNHEFLVVVSPAG